MRQDLQADITAVVTDASSMGMFRQAAGAIATLTFQRMGSSVNAFGEPLRGDDNWSNVYGLTAIEGHIAQPMRFSGEQRQPALTAAMNEYRIILFGYYPRIDGSMRVVDELGRVFNILSVNHAIEGMTEMRAEIVKPGAAL